MVSKIPRPFFWFSICNFTLLVLRLICLWYSPLELYADEAQYWLWSLQPDWGYYSKPPMIAWVIWLSTTLGDSEFYVRLASPILYSLSAWLVYAIAHQLWPAVAFWAALAYVTMPAIHIGSMLITTDALLLLFWAASLYCTLRATTSTLPMAWWTIAGAMAGFGMLSKPNMLIFLPIVVAWLWYYVPRFYMGIACAISLATIIYLPNFYWNITHHMATVNHVKGLVLGGQGRLWGSIEFIAAQFGMMGPVLFGLMLYLLINSRRAILEQPQLVLLWGLGLIQITVVLGFAMISHAYANWAAPSYVTLCVVVAYHALQSQSHRVQQAFKVGVGVNILVGIIIMLYPLLAPSDFKIGNIDPLQRLKGGKELGSTVCQIYKQYQTEHALLVSDDRKELALLGYYCMPQVLKWNPKHLTNDHFDLTTNLNLYHGYDLLLISKSEDLQQIPKPSVHEYSNFTIYYSGKIRHYKVFLLKDFQGY